MEKPNKDQLVARHLPRQARARAKVELILEATIRLLGREGLEGLEGLTTNRIADVAGISIGTLRWLYPPAD